jgi:eukaryotic-like serine/threonine-protein kinase
VTAVGPSDGSPSRCPTCDAPTDGGEFCGQCGAALGGRAAMERTEPGEPVAGQMSPAPTQPAESQGSAEAAPRAKTTQLAAGTLIDGKYSIKRVLGQGGMGVVYLASDVHTRVEVVLKAVRPELAHRKDVRERTLAEGRALARIDHPNVVRLNAVVADDTGLWLVMQYIEGESLDKTVKRYADEGQHLPFTVALDLFRQILLGVGAAHREGVIHRDLKPANILVRRKDGVAKVTDFGIAKPADEEQPRGFKTKGVIGSLWYMSPEQVQGRRDLDARADVYALGVLCFELLTGHVPFDASSSYDIMRKHVEEPLPKAKAERADLPEWIDDVLQRACAKDREKRFASCEEFLATLDALAGGRATMIGGHPTIVGSAALAPPHDTHPPAAGSTDAVASLTSPGVSEEQRKRGLGLVVGLALLLGLGAGAFLWLRSDRTERREARDAASAQPSPSSATAEVSASATTAAPSVGGVEPPPVDPLDVLVGLWRTESDRELQAVRVAGFVEFRVVDPEEFAPADYRAGEARFVLSHTGESYAVDDKIRPEPPVGYRFDSDRARTSCQEVWSSVGDRPLRAVLDGDRLSVDFAKIAPKPSNFLVDSATKSVNGCVELRKVPASLGRTVLTRVL